VYSGGRSRANEHAGLNKKAAGTVPHEHAQRKGLNMKRLHAIVATLIIIGALNWGLVGLFDFNLVAAMFGVDSWFSNLIYILVGIAALIAIFTEFAVHRGHRTNASPQPVHS
jgi:hypothetical protein